MHLLPCEADRCEERLVPLCHFINRPFPALPVPQQAYQTNKSPDDVLDVISSQGEQRRGCLLVMLD